jgi:hypothetical protein
VRELCAIYSVLTQPLKLNSLPKPVSIQSVLLDFDIIENKKVLDGRLLLEGNLAFDDFAKAHELQLLDTKTEFVTQIPLSDIDTSPSFVKLSSMLLLKLSFKMNMM